MKLFLGLLITISLVSFSCSKSSGGGDDGNKIAPDANGRMTSEVGPSGESQTLTAGDSSDLAGTSITFPPGSLAVQTDVTIEQGTPIATSANATKMSFTDPNALTSAGAATVFGSSEETEGTSAFGLAINVDQATALKLKTGEGQLIVVYKKHHYTDEKLMLGVIPDPTFDAEANIVKFESTHFGVFEPAYSTETVTESLEVETVIPIITKASPPVVSFTASAQTASEGGATVSVSIELSFAADYIVAAPYMLTGTSAEDDHGVISGSFIIPALATSQTLTFNVVDDSEKEGDETMIFTLGTPQNAIKGDVNVHTVTISDND